MTRTPYPRRHRQRHQPRRVAILRYVSVCCMGVLIFAAARLLSGYKATANCALADLLPLMGATHENAQVMQDRKAHGRRAYEQTPDLDAVFIADGGGGRNGGHGAELL